MGSIYKRENNANSHTMKFNPFNAPLYKWSSVSMFQESMPQRPDIIFAKTPVVAAAHKDHSQDATTNRGGGGVNIKVEDYISSTRKKCCEPQGDGDILKVEDDCISYTSKKCGHVDRSVVSYYGIRLPFEKPNGDDIDRDGVNIKVEDCILSTRKKCGESDGNGDIRKVEDECNSYTFKKCDHAHGNVVSYYGITLPPQKTYEDVDDDGVNLKAQDERCAIA